MTDETSAIMAAAPCRCCGGRQVYEPRWCCDACFKHLEPELKRAVWIVADLRLDDDRKQDVITRCAEFIRRRGTVRAGAR